MHCTHDYDIAFCRSKLTYTPLNNKDYGTLMCSATNEVGRQREPCIFHIILAGKLQI